MHVIGLAQKEVHPRAGFAIGRLVGRVDGEKTGLVSDVVAVLGDTNPLHVREALVSTILSWNLDKSVSASLRAIARKDKSPKLRADAVRMLWSAPETEHDATCALFLELTRDDDNEVSGEAAHKCAKWNVGDGCTAQWNALLDVVEKRAKAGSIQTTGMVVALTELKAQPKVTAVQKKRIRNIAGMVSANEANNSIARSFADDLN